MHYKRISADCHLDMPWMPPGLFVENARARPQGAHALCRGRAGRAAMGRQERRQFRAAHTASARAARSMSRDRTSASTSWPSTVSIPTPSRARPLQRPASAPQGHGDGRGRRRGHLRHSRRRLEAQRPRSQQRDAAHLQRLAEGFLQPLPRPADRSRLPALRQYRRGGRRGAPRRQDGAARPRTVLLLGHGADVAPGLGEAVAGGQRRRAAAAFPHLPDDRAALAHRGPPRSARRDVHRRLGVPDGAHPHHRRR